MKRILSVFIFSFLLAGFIHASDRNPLGFKVSYSNNSPKVGDVIEIIFKAPVPAGWHLYSEKSDCPVDDGPIRAMITVNKPNGFVLVGGVKGVGDKMVKEEEVFNCTTGEFHSNCEFRQKIKVTGPISPFTILFEGQRCTDKDGMCVSIEESISVGSLNVTGTPEKVSNDTEVIDTQLTVPTVAIDTTKSYTGGGHYKANSKSEIGTCKPKSYNGLVAGTAKNQGLWLIFWLAFLSGLAGLLTPCVFPMIPMTVSFFMKDKKKGSAMRDAAVFSLSLIGVYVILGTIVAVLVGPDAANWLSTHWIPNLFFFILFIVFAASFFGAFEIVLPSSIVNAVDKQADKGGWLGPVFMAFTIALVSFSCTGPIVGSVLAGSARGGFLLPVIAMLGYGLAFALPFGLLAMFPQYLNKLPKSGGWLNSVKVVLGFVEVAFALKFLSTADQTYHWRLLDREIYLALWIVIFTLMGIYLMGKIKFSHDSDLPYLKVPRLFMVIATFSFVVYLIPGMWGAPLKFLAGYLPPMSTQDFNLNKAAKTEGNVCNEPRYSENLHLAHGLAGYFDYDEAIACARKLKKPLFIDFTGHGCVNCRKMEEFVWSDPRVLSSLKTDFVIASLYVDDKKIKLPESEQFTGRFTGDLITTLGKKNTEIQLCYFNGISQPQYIILGPDEEMLQAPASAESTNYEPDKFLAFLQAGKLEYQKRY